MKKSFGYVVAGLLSATLAHAGGWAVITVEDLPERIVAGEAVDLTFSIRQHGRTLVPGLTPSVEARAGSLTVRAIAAPAAEVGQYLASLNLRQPGDWTLTIQSGFGQSRLTLMPLKVIDATNVSPLLTSDLERGKQLFVAKGCVMCHRHARSSPQTLGAVGHDLTSRHYQAQYLEGFLANPTVVRSRSTNDWDMPNLNLRPREITALVAFINDDRGR